MILDESTFTLFAAKHYDMKKAASAEEFYDDLKRFQYLKRLFRRYEEFDELKVRLILNHLIVIYNCFGPPATPMLFMKLEEYHKYLKPFLVYLSYLPDEVEYGEKKIITSSLPLDKTIINELRSL
jgi:hypothetical protein